MRKVLVIGITGGIGSGKTVVAELFAKKGITIIDADKLTRDLTSPNQTALKKIIEHYGPEILHKDGSLNRTKLRKIIFELPAEKRWLENLLHPLVRTEMKQQAEEALSPYCIAVIPLLFETEQNPLIDRTLVVDAPEELQIERAMTRDQQSKDHIQAIIKSQISRQQRLKLADDIIDNSGDLESLNLQVEQLHQLYLKQSEY